MPCTVTFFLTVLRLIPRSLGRVSTAIPNSPPAQDVLGPQNQRKSPNEVKDYANRSTLIADIPFPAPENVAAKRCASEKRAF